MSDSLVFTSVRRITPLPDEKPSSALSSEVEIEASAMSTWIKQVIHFLKILNDHNGFISNCNSNSNVTSHLLGDTAGQLQTATPKRVVIFLLGEALAFGL